MARPYLAASLPADTQAWLRTLMAAAKLVEITEWVVACRDPTSHKFLELAISGRADMIVTGDGNLLVLNLFREIPISSQNKAISSQSSPPQIVPNKAFNKISGSG